MAYIDPSTTSTLMRLLAPIFIILSLLGLRFKRQFKIFYSHIFNIFNNKE